MSRKHRLGLRQARVLLAMTLAGSTIREISTRAIMPPNIVRTLLEQPTLASLTRVTPEGLSALKAGAATDEALDTAWELVEAWARENVVHA